MPPQAQEDQAYTREKLNDKSPYESFSFFYGQGILEALEVKLVPTNGIILRPSLLKRQCKILTAEKAGHY